MVEPQVLVGTQESVATGRVAVTESTTAATITVHVIVSLTYPLDGTSTVCGPSYGLRTRGLPFALAELERQKSLTSGKKNFCLRGSGARN